METTGAACRAVSLRKLLSQITNYSIGSVTVFIDNKLAIDLAKNLMFHGISKNIDILYHFIRECVRNGEIVVKHVSFEEQRVDPFTKALTAVKFENMSKIRCGHGVVTDLVGAKVNKNSLFESVKEWDVREKLEDLYGVREFVLNQDKNHIMETDIGLSHDEVRPSLCMMDRFNAVGVDEILIKVSPQASYTLISCEVGIRELPKESASGDGFYLRESEMLLFYPVLAWLEDFSDWICFASSLYSESLVWVVPLFRLSPQ
ncbi:hypothetical protein AgCh_023039 [Apium graveolens]